MHAPRARPPSHTARACVRAQFAAVKDACCEYMRECLTDASAAATLSLAAKFSCDEVLV